MRCGHFLQKLPNYGPAKSAQRKRIYGSAKGTPFNSFNFQSNIQNRKILKGLSIFFRHRLFREKSPKAPASLFCYCATNWMLKNQEILSSSSTFVGTMGLFQNSHFFRPKRFSQYMSTNDFSKLLRRKQRFENSAISEL